MNDFAPRAGATQDFYINNHPDKHRAHTFDFIHNRYVDQRLQDESGRVDYILGLNSIPRGGGMRTNTMPLHALECDIIPSNVYDPQVAESSDHFAVYAKLVPSDMYI